MSVEANGGPRRLPAITVAWDADEQDVLLDFSPEAFKKWPFVIAALGMAKAKAEQAYKEQQVAALRQAAAQHAADQQLRQRLIRGN